MDPLESNIKEIEKNELTIDEWLKANQNKIKLCSYLELVVLISVPLATLISLLLTNENSFLQISPFFLPIAALQLIIYQIFETRVEKLTSRLVGLNYNDYSENKEKQRNLSLLKSTFKNLIAIKAQIKDVPKENKTYVQDIALAEINKAFSERTPKFTYEILDDLKVIKELRHDMYNLEKDIKRQLNRIGIDRLNTKKNEERNVQKQLNYERRIKAQNELREIENEKRIQQSILSKEHVANKKHITELLKEETELNVETETSELTVMINEPKDIFKNENAPNQLGHPQKSKRKSQNKSIDYVESLKQNTDLGKKGELFVLKYEKEMLSKIGRIDLANQVIHTSIENGDGSGYDIESFDKDGKAKLIEVKTTENGVETPFYLTDNELHILTTKENTYIYRVYNYNKINDTGDILIINPKNDLQKFYKLNPTNYQVIPNT